MSNIYLILFSRNRFGPVEEKADQFNRKNVRLKERKNYKLNLFSFHTVY